MSPFTIISEALQSIPAAARKGLLYLFALSVVVVTVAKIVELDWNYDKIFEVLTYLGGYLGVQSAANVNPPVSTEAGDAGIMAEE